MIWGGLRGSETADVADGKRRPGAVCLDQLLARPKSRNGHPTPDALHGGGPSAVAAPSLGGTTATAGSRTALLGGTTATAGSRTALLGGTTATAGSRTALPVGTTATVGSRTALLVGTTATVGSSTALRVGTTAT